MNLVKLWRLETGCCEVRLLFEGPTSAWLPGKTGPADEQADHRQQAFKR